jgi:hypothetical protein
MTSTMPDSKVTMRDGRGDHASARKGRLSSPDRRRSPRRAKTERPRRSGRRTPLDRALGVPTTGTVQDVPSYALGASWNRPPPKAMKRAALPCS